MVEASDNSFVRREGEWCVKSATKYDPGAVVIVAKRGGFTDKRLGEVLYVDRWGNYVYEIVPLRICN